MDSQHQPIPEITIKAVTLGVVLSVVLAAANAYLGLFAGMTVCASIPAAVVSMALLRLFRKSNILENNIVQTAASAGESLAAGVIFTLPALVIMNFWTEFNFLWVTVIAGFGGLLGVLFTIPLRRALIVEAKLKFPEGVATAEVLRSGQEGVGGVKCIAKAAVVAGIFKFGEAGLQIWNGVFEAARGLGGTIAYFGSNLSPALLAVGYIVGLNVAVLIFLGGLLNWFVAIPVCAATQSWPVAEGQPIPALEWAHEIWSQQTRYIGVGAMLVGGLWTIIRMRSSIISGISGGLQAYRRVSIDRVEIPRTGRDMPMKWILILIAVSALPLFLLYQTFVKDVTVTLPMALVMLILGFVFSAVAGYMGGLVGSSNNPISGVTIATVLLSALLLLFLMGRDAANGPAAVIIIGSVVCCAASIAGDNLQDLKTGHIVQATPWKQQVMQMIGTVSAAFVMAPVLTLLLKAYGFAGHESATRYALPAPQANLMASVADGVFEGRLPWVYVFIGMVVAVAVIAVDVGLEKKRAAFRAPVLAVAIGFYLPFQLSVPIFAGGIIHRLISSRRRPSQISSTLRAPDKMGLLFASGLITGEALVGILLAIPIFISGQQDVLAVLERPVGTWPGTLLLIAVAYWLYRTAGRRAHASEY